MTDRIEAIVIEQKRQENALILYQSKNDIFQNDQKEHNMKMESVLHRIEEKLDDYIKVSKDAIDAYHNASEFTKMLVTIGKWIAGLAVGIAAIAGGIRGIDYIRSLFITIK